MAPIVMSTTKNTKQETARGNDAAPAVRFTRASVEHTEPGGYDDTITAGQFAAGPRTVTFDVPAHGYLRRLLLLIETDGNGAQGVNPAVAQADAPWTFIRSISFKDVNGGNIYGPISGFNFYLANKWGGYSYDDNPVNDPNYSAIDADGEFSFRLDIPLEAIARDALAALPNLNSSSTYKVEITIADDGDVYSTPPDTLPGVRVRAFLDAWSKPSAVDPMGTAQETAPKHEGTTQMWSRASASVAGAGEFTLRLPRVGNFIRTLIFVLRDSDDCREGDTFPDTVKLTIDGQTLHSEPSTIRRAIMAEQYGYALAAMATADFDEGVLVYPFSHDFDGKPGAELRDLWLPTVQSSRLEFTLANAGEAGTLEVITNDISLKVAG